MNEKDIKIQYKDISEIIPYKNNPRKNDLAVNAVCESIKIAGFINPIVIDKNNEIIAGHTRLKAAKKLGLKKIPVILKDDLTDEQIKIYRIADNKTSEFASWNNDLLSIELSDIKDFDMSVFDIIDIDKSEQLEKQNKKIYPYQYCHVLITLPVSQIEDIPKIIKFCENNGFEYEQSNN